MTNPVTSREGPTGLAAHESGTPDPHGHATLACTELQVEIEGRTVLHGVSLALQRGWTALVGPNGAGKSTLLKACAGLLAVRAGQLWMGGRKLEDLTRAQRARMVAWLPQQDGASGDLTVRETVGLGRLPHTGLWGRWRPRDTHAVHQAMQRTDCVAWQDRPAQGLSGGERQRVHLARALATGADILLLDEPMAHLDPPHQWAMACLFRELAATHTVVTVLHDPTMALQADRVVAMHKGRIHAYGPHDDPALHRALERLFSPAVRIEPLQISPGRFGAVPMPLDARGADQSVCPEHRTIP